MPARISRYEMYEIIPTISYISYRAEAGPVLKPGWNSLARYEMYEMVGTIPSALVLSLIVLDWRRRP